MMLTPPMTSLTDSLFSYTALLRSARPAADRNCRAVHGVDDDARYRRGVHGRRHRLQIRCRAVPHVAAGRLSRRADPDHAVHRLRAEACGRRRSEEHKSELQSLMRNSYAVFCSKKKNRYKKRK